MATIRRTISLPPNLAERLEKEAEELGLTFSALIAQKISDEPADLPYAGLIDDVPDLSLRVEEVLARLAD